MEAGSTTPCPECNHLFVVPGEQEKIAEVQRVARQFGNVALQPHVVTLAVEVSQRVRASLITTEVIPVVEVVEQIETLTPEEVIVRRKSELVDLALLCRTQRYFTTENAQIAQQLINTVPRKPKT